jgi:hypothetical protein
MGLPHGKYNGEVEMAELFPLSKHARRLFNCHIYLLPSQLWKNYNNELNDVGAVALIFRWRQKNIDKEMGASVLTMTVKRGRK